MNCDTLRYQLADFATGTLSREDMELVSRHLSGCRSCREEVEQLSNLIAELKSTPAWAPPQNYFNNLLPRIHRRREERKVWILPQWITRLVMPAAAAALCVAVLLHVTPSTFRNGEGDLNTVLRQFQPDELQEAVEHQISAGLLEAPVTSESQSGTAFADDKELLKVILMDVERPYTSVESMDLESQSSIENINDQDAEKIVEILRQKSSVD